MSTTVVPWIVPLTPIHPFFTIFSNQRGPPKPRPLHPFNLEGPLEVFFLPALVGPGTARDRATPPSLAPLLWIIPGAGLGAWVCVTGRSRCRARFFFLTGPPPFAPEWAALPCPDLEVVRLPASCLSSGPLPQLGRPAGVNKKRTRDHTQRGGARRYEPK